MATLKATPENYKRFGVLLYENAKHPLWHSRMQEYAAAKKVAAMRHGVELSEADFDNIIAEHFNDGIEYEWPRP